MYVVLNKDQFDDIIAICVCVNKSDAAYLVTKRNEKFPDNYCWYQEVEQVSFTKGMI